MGGTTTAAAGATFFFAAAAAACVFAGDAQSISGAGGALYGGYRYDGRAVCAASAVVTLDSATVYPGRWSHAAVWSGVSFGGATDWVQAGITQGPGQAAFAYVEWLTIAGTYKLLRLGPPRSSLRVRLTYAAGGLWTLTAGSKQVTMRLDPKTEFNHDARGPGTRCFIGAESEDWSRPNAMHGSVSVDGAAAFGVKL